MSNFEITDVSSKMPAMRAVVTGASSGIGLECCRELLARGWDVVGVDIAESPLLESERPVFEPQQFSAVYCDVSASAEVDHAFRIIEAGGQIDALICCAGILRGGPLIEMSEKDYDAVFDINTKGSWLVARAALPLIKASHERAGRIIFVASGAALRPKIGAAAYAASKIALIHLTRVLAVELASRSILVNAVAPATVDTPMVQRLRESDHVYNVTGISPLGRVAQPSDVTSVIRFLLGPDSGYMTGSVLVVDGGTTAAFVA